MIHVARLLVGILLLTGYCHLLTIVPSDMLVMFVLITVGYLFGLGAERIYKKVKELYLDSNK